MNSIIIDVRDPSEFATGHIAQALNIPLPNIMQDSSVLENMSKNSHIIVYCRSGNRSEMAKNILEQQGYSNVTNGINQENVQATYLN